MDLNMLLLQKEKWIQKSYFMPFIGPKIQFAGQKTTNNIEFLFRKHKIQDGKITMAK